MREALQLRRDRRLHLGMHMAGVEHRDAARKVDETPPLDVPELGVLGTVDEEVPHHAHATRRGIEPTLVPGGIGVVGFDFVHGVH